jgi:hypothetical protein
MKQEVRLRNRGTETEASIKSRLETALQAFAYGITTVFFCGSFRGSILCFNA